jgi:signal transduction histidine kinase
MLVKAMHGSLSLVPRPEGGTRATVRLPLGPAPSALRPDSDIRGLA